MLIISHGRLVASDTPDHLSRLAEGSNTLNMLIKGEKELIENGLKEIDKVKETELVFNEEEGAWNVSVSTEEQEDIREEVFLKMAELHCPILEMKSKKVSLEEIFLELTESEKNEETNHDSSL